MPSPGSDRRFFAVEWFVRLFAAMMLLMPSGALRAQTADSTPASRALPITEVAPQPAATTLAIFISGDGGWADLDRTVSAELARHGFGIVGLDARAYLRRRPTPTPDVLGRDVTRLATTYMARWGLHRLVLIGYSRGADLVPFAATRLGDDPRARLVLVAMLGVATNASFEFHWADLLGDTRRATDKPILPELERLRDVKLFCVYGTEEKDSLCRDASLPNLEKMAREGGHHFDGDDVAIARAILAAMP